MTSPPPRKPASANLWLALFAAYLLALFTGTHLPPEVGSLPGDQSDKLLHFAAYAGLAWLLGMAWESSTGRLNGRHLWFAWLAITGFAAVDEVTQLLVHRDADPLDWLADAAGAAVGLGVFLLVRRATANL
jgi:VanZ family protein